MFSLAISFAWYWLPIALFVVGAVGFVVIDMRTRYMDFFHPALAFLFLAVCWTAAGAIVFTRLVLS